MEQKMHVNVASKDGEILFGNHFHELLDETGATFVTDDLNAFVRYMREKAKYVCYHTNENVQALPPAVDHATVPYAECKVRPTWLVRDVLHIVSNWHTINNLERALRPLRNYLCPAGRSLLHNLSDFTVNKVLNYRRYRDHQGNYEVQVKRSAGTDDVQIPGTITLTLPIVQWCEESREIELDVEFQVSDSEEKPTMQFMLRNPALNDALIRHTAEIVESRLDELGVPTYRGHCLIVKQDDSWRYQPNKVEWA